MLRQVQRLTDFIKPSTPSENTHMKVQQNTTQWMSNNMTILHDHYTTTISNLANTRSPHDDSPLQVPRAEQPSPPGSPIPPHPTPTPPLNPTRTRVYIPPLSHTLTPTPTRNKVCIPTPPSFLLGGTLAQSHNTHTTQNHHNSFPLFPPSPTGSQVFIAPSKTTSVRHNHNTPLLTTTKSFQHSEKTPVYKTSWFVPNSQTINQHLAHMITFTNTVSSFTTNIAELFFHP